jgi:hypothetical protein
MPNLRGLPSARVLSWWSRARRLSSARSILAKIDASGSRANVYPWRSMPKDEKDQQQTEQTPKGLTVPVPKRETFLGNLKKAAKPEPPKRDSPAGED